MTSSPLLLLGGSFNPPHSGHMRIAIETAEALRPALTLFIPCARPPHKQDGNLLPFSLRARMLRAAVSGMADPKLLNFAVSEVENQREGPSYTVDTLAVLRRQYPGMRPAFAIGSDDYAQLSSWRRWREIPALADLVVLPRNAGGADSFRNSTLAFWPEARDLAPPSPRVHSAFSLPGGGSCLYLPQPQFDISSSLIRERVLEGRSIDFLVPCGVARLLKKRKDAVTAVWSHY